MESWGTADPSDASAEQSSTPFPVVSTNGKSTLDDVVSLASMTDAVDTAFGDVTYCALPTSRRVDCWGYGANGQLGNGHIYGVTGESGSPIPVPVVSTSGKGSAHWSRPLRNGRAGPPIRQRHSASVELGRLPGRRIERRAWERQVLHEWSG